MKFSDERFRKGSRLFLLLYLIIGLGGLATQQQEIFPVFSWFLFPITPQMTQTEYNLRLFEVNDIYRSAEPFYKDAPSAEYAEKPHSPEAWQIIQNMGKAYVAGDQERVDQLRRLLEISYIPNVTGYALIEIGYNPIKRFQQDPDAFGERTLERFQRLEPKGDQE